MSPGIEEDNPFDAPMADDESDEAVDPVGFAVEGDRLWIPHPRPWPRWCVTCGAPAVGVADRNLRYRPSLRLGWSLMVHLPMCRRHLERYRWRSRVAGVLAIAAAAMLVLGPASLGPSAILIALGLFAASGLVKGESALRAVARHDGRYLLVGVSRAYRERVRAAVDQASA